MEPLREAMDLAKRVDPTPKRLFAEVHGNLRDDILGELTRVLKFKEARLLVLLGMLGTPLERIDQVLADYLEGDHSSHTFLKDFHAVLKINLDSVRQLADQHGSEHSRSVLNAAFDLADDMKAILLLDHIEVLLDPAYLPLNGVVETDLRGVLTQPRNAAVIALYWQSGSNSVADSVSEVSERMKAIRREMRNAFPIEVKPYKPAQARSTIIDHFFPYWKVEAGGYTFTDNAFEVVFALRDWIRRGGEPIALPYSAIFVGTNTIETARSGSSDISSRAKRALETLEDLQQEADQRRVTGYFAALFSDITASLQHLISSTEAESRGTKILTCEHVIAELLASANYEVVLPSSVPRGVLEYMLCRPEASDRQLDPPRRGRAS